MRSEPIQLTRDCLATSVPGGEPMTLRKGEPVVISQALGGSYTVMTQDGVLARVAAGNADAIGEVVAAGSPPPSPAAGGQSLEEQVQAELKTIYDPEIPVDIVELGLIYGTEIVEIPGGGREVRVAMTLTAPGCGIGDVLRDEVHDKIAAVPGVTRVKVEIVFDPPWEPSRMSEAAKLATGIYW
jgi:probable FeS assembly SUF system protein SufT